MQRESSRLTPTSKKIRRRLAFAGSPSRLRPSSSTCRSASEKQTVAISALGWRGGRTRMYPSSMNQNASIRIELCRKPRGDDLPRPVELRPERAERSMGTRPDVDDVIDARTARNRSYLTLLSHGLQLLQEGRLEAGVFGLARRVAERQRGPPPRDRAIAEQRAQRDVPRQCAQSLARSHPIVRLELVGSNITTLGENGMVTGQLDAEPTDSRPLGRAIGQPVDRRRPGWCRGT